MIGSICHRVLEEWDFQASKEAIESLVESATKWALAIEKIKAEAVVQQQVIKPQFSPFNTLQIQDTELIKAEVIKILSDFIDSEAYEELQNAQILGREIPILLRWDRHIMRGTIDVLYKIGNRIIIADYKTDHVKPTDLQAMAEKYQHQKGVYIEAVKRCLQIDNPEFKLIFLRLGKSVCI